MRTTREMAIEAELHTEDGFTQFAYLDCLENFEALVRADEREMAIERAFIAMLGANHELTLRVIRAIRAKGKQ
jgi:arginase family enzyme